MTNKDIAEEMVWLAFQASSPMGLGFMHTKIAAAATKEEVVKAAKWNDVYCIDYLFGRMVKLNIKLGHKDVIFPQAKPRSDYQSWCNKYPTYEDLQLEAMESLEG